MRRFGWCKSTLFVALAVMASGSPTRAYGDDTPASQGAPNDAADSTRKARRLFEQAETQYRLGNFDSALRAYQAALERRPDPSLVFNIAQCFRQLKNRERAVFYYRLFLSDWERANPGITPPNEAEVRQFIKELEQPEPAPVPPSPPPPVAAPLASAVAADSEAAATRRSKTIWGYTFLGIGVALGVTAGALYGVAKGQGDDAHTQYMAATDPQTTTDRRGDVESANSKIIACYVLTGAAVAALGFSLYELLSRPSAEEASRASRVTIAPLPGGAAVILGGRF